MSRIGKKPIQIPEGVEVKIVGSKVDVTGPHGSLSRMLHPDMAIVEENRVLSVTRPSDGGFHRSLHGLTRTLVANMIIGVSEGFRKNLDLVGVGYRVQQIDAGISLQVGYSHTVEVVPLPGVSLTVEGNNRIHVDGPDKEAVGEVAARIRAIRPPDAYKGKGVRYAGEKVRLKPGKSAKRA